MWPANYDQAVAHLAECSKAPKTAALCAAGDINTLAPESLRLTGLKHALK